ncbi:MAG: hypothetical protein AAFW60_06110, partial [Pseudomonadota bacterium]
MLTHRIAFAAMLFTVAACATATTPEALEAREQAREEARAAAERAVEDIEALVLTHRPTSVDPNMHVRTAKNKQKNKLGP